MYIFNEKFNLGHQITDAGTLQNIKSSFNHNKVVSIYIKFLFIALLQASKDVSHFYASWDLMEVTNLINLMGLVESLTGHELEGSDAGLSCEQFMNVVDTVFNNIDQN